MELPLSDRYSGWRDALVEMQSAGRYLLHHGRGEKRWADGGEIAWHDIAPMPFDVAEAKPMLGWQVCVIAMDPLVAWSPPLSLTVTPPMHGWQPPVGSGGGGKKQKGRDGGGGGGATCQSAYVDREVQPRMLGLRRAACGGAIAQPDSVSVHPPPCTDTEARAWRAVGGGRCSPAA